VLLEDASMRRLTFLFVILNLLACAAVSGAQGTTGDTAEEKRKDAMSLKHVDSPGQLASRIGMLFSGSPVTDVNKMTLAPDCSVALAAGWERVRRTMPEAEQRDVISPDRVALSRFLGLVEGRIQVPIPDAWEATVTSTKGYGKAAIWFPRLELVDKQLVTRRPLRDGERWMVKMENLSLKLAAEDGLGPVDNFATVRDGEIVYVALYGSRPTPFRLFAVNRDNARPIWSTKVWAAGGLVEYEGKGWHLAEIRLVGERLAVFGISDDSAYVEAFDKKTGANQCRFSTAYFDGPRRGR
jgi:hypothetical protein